MLTEPSELGTRLPRAHFALTGGDGLSLEMACVGVPQLIITQNARHVPNAKKMDEDGAATYLGRRRPGERDHLRDAVNYVLDDQLERVGMARCARLMIDGRGPDRIVNGLEILIHAPSRAGPAAAGGVVSSRCTVSRSVGQVSNLSYGPLSFDIFGIAPLSSSLLSSTVDGLSYGRTGAAP